MLIGLTSYSQSIMGIIASSQISSGSSTPPTVLTDGNTVAWYKSDEPTTITMDGSNLVSSWSDYLGSGHDLIQATGTNQPLWSESGILFDGVDNFMKAVFTYNQPCFIYMVFRNLAYINGLVIFSGGNTDVILYETTSTQFKLQAGTASVASTTLTLGSFGVGRFLLYGASSKMIINAGTPTTGNFGAVNMGGFSLGYRSNTNGSFSNIQVKEIILRSISDNSTDETAIYNYLKAKYGL